jgi:hypothetical protein
LDVVVCLNERQAEKDAADRNAIIESLKEICGKVFQAVGVALPPTIREVP